MLKEQLKKFQKKRVSLKEQLFSFKLHNRKSILTKAFLSAVKVYYVFRNTAEQTNIPPNINMYMSNNMSLLYVKLEKTVQYILSAYYSK